MWSENINLKKKNSILNVKNIKYLTFIKYFLKIEN